MKWTKKFPDKIGWYWFYGYRFKGADNKKLCAVHVRNISNGLAFICNGSFMYKSETGKGYFVPMMLPTIPMRIEK